ncbi:MAG: hypothetical protein ACI84S_000616 [Thalassomonas sp.]|jgi:hypothetical protein
MKIVLCAFNLAVILILALKLLVYENLTFNIDVLLSPWGNSSN